jgi:hypothetical protein
VRYTANLVSNTPHVVQFRLCELWYRDIQCNYRSAYSCFNIRLNVSALILEMCRKFSEHHTANMVPIQHTFFSFRCLNRGLEHIQCKYSSAYSGFNIQLNVSALILEIYRQLNVRYTANTVPNTARILRSALSELWSRTYTMYLQLRIFRLQYSTERICAAIVDITIIQCALYCKLRANTAHILQFTLCELWSRPYTRYLHFRIFRLQYSNEGSSPAIGDISTIQARYTAKLVPNTAPVLQFTPCELWSRPYTKYL